MGIPEGEEREKGTEEIFETVMTKIFHKLASDAKPQNQEGQKTLKRINAKKPHLASHLQTI